MKHLRLWHAAALLLICASALIGCAHHGGYGGGCSEGCPPQGEYGGGSGDPNAPYAPPGGGACSGLTLLYYARFWFAYHASSTPLLGTPDIGVEFFHFVVTWLEYCPWLIWLMWTPRVLRCLGRS